MTSKSVSVQGVDDLVLLGKGKISEAGVGENLEKRYNNQLIYTYIGPVLISVNPYKDLGNAREDKVPIYHGHYPFENPPHIFALGEEAHRSMRSDQHNQCVLISGESGAGKTECAKLLMSYIAWVTGKSEKVTYVKDCVLQSNPFLEAFGNAKTLRNNNSSRFGKYFEIQFDAKGDPCGGMITNYLLEKSRIVYQQGGERNFHIFYNLTKGADQTEQQNFQLYSPDQFWYTCQGEAYDVVGIDDVADYREVRGAMTTVGLSDQQQYDLMLTVSGVLHVGNIQFQGGGKGHATVADQGVLQLAAGMIGIDPQMLAKAMTSRQIQTGGSGQSARGSRYNVPLNPEQATGSRDALAREMYSRQFDHIVGLINSALQKYKSPFKNVIGILDIFGFEIFEHNGFEQFCINYVNEKLQQYFIELTLKAEQEEYVAEGIEWTPVKYFNNKVVCDLVEGKVGMFGVLDDVCYTVHAESGDMADGKFLEKASGQFGSHAHFRPFNNAFQIKHYAGDVTYEVSGFTDKNKDTLFGDLVEALQTSSLPYLASLFPENVSTAQRKRPTTAGLKIKSSAQALMKTLSECNPHYIRCIKPNENKSASEWDQARCKHQIQYLGLLENVRVRRAGFCFRAPFARFLKKYMYLSPKTWTPGQGAFKGDARQGCATICQDLQIAQDQWQTGKTKMFIRHPETLFFLEEEIERKDYEMACMVQKVWKSWTMAKRALEQRSRVAQLFKGQKERQRNSVGRQFTADYMNYDKNFDLASIIRSYSDQETVLFADQVVKLNRRSRPERRDFVITDQAFYFVARAKKNGQNMYKLSRRCAIADIGHISLSSLADNWIVIHVPKEYDAFFENDKKTEICACLLEASKNLTGREVSIQFSDNITAKVQSGDTRTLQFGKNESASTAQLKKAGRNIRVEIASGMDKNTDSTPQMNSMAAAGPRGGGAARGGAPRGGGAAPRGGGAAPRGGGAPANGGAPRGAARGGGAPRGGPRGGRGAPRGGGRGGGGAGAAPSLPTCTALYAYQAAAQDELSFNEGDIITVLSKDGDWWKGELNGQQGFMPANYVQQN